MVAMPSGPDAPQRWPFHQSTCTASASPVGLSLASGVQTGLWRGFGEVRVLTGRPSQDWGCDRQLGIFAFVL